MCSYVVCGCFELQGQSWVVVTEYVCSAKLDIHILLTIWLFTEFADLCCNPSLWLRMEFFLRAQVKGVLISCLIEDQVSSSIPTWVKSKIQQIDPPFLYSNFCILFPSLILASRDIIHTPPSFFFPHETNYTFHIISVLFYPEFSGCLYKYVLGLF